MNDSTTSLPKWFYAVAIIALIWNIMGVMAYLGQTMGDHSNMPADMKEMIENRPAWATASFAVAVWGGLLGCILLLLKKSLSYIVFLLSLIGIIFQMTYNLFIAETTMDYGPFAIAMTLLIPLIAIYLVYVAKKGKSEGWLN